MGPFEVTKETIRQLTDEQLRELLSMLLEAEAKRLGISPKAIAIGGNQTAKDGGVDGAISWDGNPPPKDWLPRRTIFFQCKAEPMRPAGIAGEMRPKDVARPIFAELAKVSGAYIIFATDDPTGSAYANRLEAMAAAIEDVPHRGEILLDFYGADKIARWSNQHIGVAARVLGWTGRPLSGWQPYGDWSAPGSSSGTYAFDENARAIVDGEELAVIAAIARVREILAEPGGAVRVVGISGMGKTRFAEALFDERIDVGTPLPPLTAIYADLGLDPAIGAAVLAEQLVLTSADAVIVADNSNIRTHAQLAQAVARAGSRSRVLTIDYDATGERPSGTLFVTLTDNSEDVLTTVLEQRCPRLNQAERRHLAQFSGGNARIALKVAESSVQGIDLSTLKDSELLERLFQRGRAELDVEARRVADAASLVYAFYAEEGDQREAEHPLLAEIAEVSPDAFYRHIGTFLDWGIAQRRGPQRAIMPPPLANMLAAPVIRRSDPSSLVRRFASGPPRLFASFARRLGYLHNEPAAVSIVDGLFAEGGFLGEPSVNDEVLRRAFVHATPASPESSLTALERCLGREASPLIAATKSVQREFAQLLVFIGHEPALFWRAMEALLSLLIRAEVDNSDEQLRDLFLERFWPVLSFTLADGTERLKFIDRLLDDPDPKVRGLGVEALDHMLDSGHFSSSLFLELGSLPRISSWKPVDAGYDAWLQEAYDRLVGIVAKGGLEAKRAAEVIARHFREHLPAHAAIAIPAVRAIKPAGYWDEGWRAICDALHFERKGLPDGVRNDAERLEFELRPKSLIEFFEAFVLGDSWRHHHPNGRERPFIRNTGILAEGVGRCAARAGHDLRPLLNEASVAKGQSSVGQFGRGLGKNCGDLDRLWELAYESLLSASFETRNPGVLAGILEGAYPKDHGWVARKLNEAVTDPVLSDYLVILHAGLELDATSMARFTGALRAKAITPENFSLLMMGGKTKPVPADALAAFLKALFAFVDGTLPALQVLHMRLYGDRSDGREVDEALVDLGREFLSDPRTFAEQNEREDHGIATIAKVALAGDGGEAAAIGLCRALRDAASGSNRISYRDFDEVCAVVAKMHPRVVLDEIVASSAGDDVVQRFFGGIFRDDEDRNAKIALDEDTVISWVNEDAGERAKRLAKFVPYAVALDGGNLEWSSIALRLIEAAPDRVAVLEAFEARFWTGASWGPFSGRFVRRRPLVAAFADDNDVGARRWARSAGLRLEENIRRWNDADRLGDSRFE